MADIIVIGAGQAGASLVAELRDQGFSGSISLIGEEPVPPYQRPPLSKGYLLGDLTADRLYLRPERYYADQHIDLRLQSRVRSVDPNGQTVQLESEQLPYGQLAFTTGSRPITLPAHVGGDLKGVFVVRTLADVDAVAPLFQPDSRLLIVGGGYIGLEAAAVAAKLGVRVTLVELAERILQRVAASETSDYFRALHEQHGVNIRESVGLSRLIGDSKVSSAVFTDEDQLDVDFVVVGVGITPNTALADAARIKVENGIAVDQFGRTSDVSVWAAGDCCSFPYKGGRLRLESVPNAIDQAACVARNMLGGHEEYVPKPWFWSDQYDVKLQIAGLNQGYDRVAVRRGDKMAVSHWYYQGDTLLAVDALNDPRSYMVGKRLIEAGVSPASDLVSDPTVDLKSLLKS